MVILFWINIDLLLFYRNLHSGKLKKIRSVQKRLNQGLSKIPEGRYSNIKYSKHKKKIAYRTIYIYQTTKFN